MTDQAAARRPSVGRRLPTGILRALRRVDTARPGHRTDRARSDMGSYLERSAQLVARLLDPLKTC